MCILIWSYDKSNERFGAVRCDDDGSDATHAQIHSPRAVDGKDCASLADNLSGGADESGLAAKVGGPAPIMLLERFRATFPDEAVSVTSRAVRRIGEAANKFKI